MVKRFQNLDVYQKGILILLVAMTVVFAFVYAATIARMGYLYQEEIFVPTEENGTTVYSGKLDDMECRFEVTAEKKLTFHTEEKVYGPYTAKEDPTAIPEDDSFSELMTGVEVREGDEIRFRGGIFDMTGDGSYMILIREDGRNLSYTTVTYSSSSGGEITLDADGNVIDPLEPSIDAIVDLITGPELTHKGSWAIWFYGLALAIFAMVSILFADELFRWELAFRIRNVDRAEPSDWEMGSRYLGWILMTAIDFAIYFVGLKA